MFIIALILLQVVYIEAASYSIAALTAGTAGRNLAPVVVIGSGPAGLAAALYTARAKIPTYVIRGNEPGGQLMGSTWVENMPGVEPDKGYKIMQGMEERAAQHGVQFIDGFVEEIAPLNFFNPSFFKLRLDSGLELHALTVIIATGARARVLDIPGEAHYMNKSIFTCAVCDCAQAQDKAVIVVGGGDSSIEAIMHLAPYAKSITLVVRKDHLRASAVMQDRLHAYSTVRVLFNSEPLSFVGDPADATQLAGMRIKNTRTHEDSVIPADCVFLAIGHEPHSEPFRQLIACDDHGYIHLVGRTQKTSVPGIFAAGDVADSVYRQAGSAAGDAVKAGLDAIAYLHEHGFNEKLSQELTSYYFKQT